MQIVVILLSLLNHMCVSVQMEVSWAFSTNIAVMDLATFLAALVLEVVESIQKETIKTVHLNYTIRGEYSDINRKIA